MNLPQSASDLLATAKKEISSLQQLWKSVDDAYPGDYQGVTTKSEALIECLSLLEGGHVLDIGCNSGFYSLLLGKVAASVIGVDPSEALISRANLARKYFENSVYSAHNVEFRHGNFADQILNSGVDTVLASLVLYHVGDRNIKILQEALVTNVNRILIQCRPARDVVFTAKPQCGPVATTKVYNGLYKIEDCLDFLRDCGFSNATVFKMDVKFYAEYFPIIYAEK